MIRYVFVFALACAAQAAQAQVKVDLYTAAGVSTSEDFSGCADVSVRGDQSVSDASTDAKLEVLACRGSADAWSSCAVLRTIPGDIADGSAASIGAPPADRPYLMTRAAVSPSSDTARVILACEEYASARERGCRVVPFAASGAGTYGPYTIYGQTLRFDLDGNATSSADTTGATAEVTGNTDFGTLTFSSCDLVGGDDACAVYDGTTGAAGFVATAPRTVSVEITAAANPGTFTLCAW
mgnify:CR=1 FL=1|jgi:hypothetical protein